MVDEQLVKAAIASILESSLAIIKGCCLNGDPKDAALEVYHVHNLPGLLAKFHDTGLAYYWNIERPSYMNKAKPKFFEFYQGEWGEIRAYLFEKNLIEELEKT